MSVLVRETGLVLRRLRHGETSLILTLFTRERGKVGLVAKGARGKRKIGSTTGLELLAEGQFVYYHKPGRELHLLKEWSATSLHERLRTELHLLTVGSALAELILRSLREEDPHQSLYETACRTLDALDQLPVSPLPILWQFELALLSELGFELRFETCAATGKLLTPPFQRGIRYHLLDGSFLHPDAQPNDPADGSLSAEAFAILARLSAAGPALAGRLSVTAATQQEVNGFLARYLEAHLPVRGRLRSLDALRWSDPSATSNGSSQPS